MSTDSPETKVAAPRGRSAPRQRFEFPRNTLEDALRVAQAIENGSGGLPLTPLDTAGAMGLRPASEEYRVLVSSSFKYGLTKGTHVSPSISIEPLGFSIVRPQTQEELNQALIDAALYPQVFAKMFELLKGKKIPEDKRFLQNTINRELEIPKEQTELCVNNFVANMEFVGLVRRINNGSYLSSNTASTALPIPANGANAEPSKDEEIPDFSAIPQETITGKPTAPAPPVKNAIFVGHGKNKAPLEQMKAILNQYAIPHKIAIDEPNAFRPISQKVSETMQECGAGILIFTADEEFRDKDGNTIWRPSENVVYELGAASILYGKKVIIFKEKDVTFPTNFKEIGYIEFEKDALIAKANDLFKELIDFGLITVHVAV